jgi:hypothetical protein
MTENVTIDPNTTTAESSVDEVRFNRHSRSWGFVTHRLPRRVPLFIPRGQIYYWTREWQYGEAEADAELRRGEGVTFLNPQDAFRWLDSPED